MKDKKVVQRITRRSDIFRVAYGNRKNVEKDLAIIPTPIMKLACVTDRPFDEVNQPVQ